ncbi:MAG: TlpA disulfide reductase family protein [Methylacidiphilales bacterium]|nr:TlpA disulfide reductase family protein [Candidatus Methylacidiphilales bacterium]
MNYRSVILIGFCALLCSAQAQQTVLPNHDLTKGAELTYLDFWASWCSPCATSFPWMEKMNMSYQSKGLRIVAVNMDEDPEAKAAFLKKHKISFTIIDDGIDAATSKKFEVETLPTSFLLNSKGEIIARHNGFTLKSGHKIEQEIKNYLTKPLPSNEQK